MISKILYWWKKPKLIFISAGNKSSKIENILIKLLKDEKNVFVFNAFTGEPNRREIRFLFKNSSLPVIVYRKNEKRTDNLFPAQIVCMTDDMKDLISFKKVDISTAGFVDSADFSATEINRNSEINFKIVHGGDTVPFWIGENMDDEELKDFLLAIAATSVIGHNLVQISQSLKLLKFP